jgi:DNA polymerase III epsilon subunit-like protein
MVKILVFDTETTDKPPYLPGAQWAERQSFDKSLLTQSGLETSWVSMKDKWPSIIQLSYILYDTDYPESAKIFNKYIDIPDNIVISEGGFKIHHITREKIASAPSENRATIEDTLNEFLQDVKISEVVVGHNVQFDRKMVVSELLRLSEQSNLPEIQLMMDDSKFECTMEKTIQICKLQQKIDYTDKITGKPKFFYKLKNPKLLESYKHFFGYEPAGEALHDALVDVVVCLRIYCKCCLEKYSLEPFDICGTNSIITDYIVAISPKGYTCPGLEIQEKQTITGGSRRPKKVKKIKKFKSKKTITKIRKSKKRRTY